MNPSLIPQLLADLKAWYPTPSPNCATNPYSAASRADNLEAYLRALCAHTYSGHLFVGEAPGYLGCALTGIPFTSERMLNSHPPVHPFLAGLRPRLAVLGNTYEQTAETVWNAFAGKRTLAAFWNVFPFHPHESARPDTNRPPTASEKAAGIPLLRTVGQIFDPGTIVSVGRHAEPFAKKVFPTLHHATLRHPANGGKAAFLYGFASLGVK